MLVQHFLQNFFCNTFSQQLVNRFSQLSQKISSNSLHFATIVLQHLPVIHDFLKRFLNQCSLLDPLKLPLNQRPLLLISVFICGWSYLEGCERGAARLCADHTSEASHSPGPHVIVLRTNCKSLSQQGFPLSYFLYLFLSLSYFLFLFLSLSLPFSAPDYRLVYSTY